jgi:hypothetical protein
MQLTPKDQPLPDGTGLSRRALLAAVSVAAPMWWLLPSRAHAKGSLDIHPRGTWGSDLPPRGPMQTERPGDVRFLLVHHTESTNDYSRADVPRQLRAFYRYHTETKGWPDIAYNFLVDAYGGVWEGRAGSLRRPVKGDATLGSQGFAVLACYIGNHKLVPPTPAAQSAMVRLLAQLARTYEIDTSRGATASFISRGSSRYPAGSHVVARTISGHRDMSTTTDCPGNAAYALIPAWRARAHALAPAVHPATVKAAATLSSAQDSPTSTPTSTTASVTEPRPAASASGKAMQHRPEPQRILAAAGAAITAFVCAAGIVVKRRLAKPGKFD